jgi:hypothetical protein
MRRLAGSPLIDPKTARPTLCSLGRVPRSEATHPWLRVLSSPAFVGDGRAPERAVGTGFRAGRPRATSQPLSAPLATDTREAPALPFANQAFGYDLQAKWWHGVGRRARQKRGDIVRTSKDLRVRSRSLGVQTDKYRCLYHQSRRLSFSFEES